MSLIRIQSLLPSCNKDATLSVWSTGHQQCQRTASNLSEQLEFHSTLSMFMFGFEYRLQHCMPNSFKAQGRDQTPGKEKSLLA